MSNLRKNIDPNEEIDAMIEEKIESEAFETELFNRENGEQ